MLIQYGGMFLRKGGMDGTPIHVHLYNKKALQIMINNAGFKKWNIYPQ